MKREDVRAIFADATDEQINTLLDAVSADIGRAKAPAEKLRADLDARTAELDAARQTISGLEASKADADALQKQIDDYKAAEAARAEAEAAAEAKRAVADRMTAVLGGRTFVHPRMQDLVAQDFGDALKDPANTGKSDAEIFDALTRDQGYFASQNPGPGNMAAPGEISETAAQMAAMRAAMGLPAQKG